MPAGIYEIVNIKNNKRYIGSAINLSKRISKHRQYLKKNTHINKHLQSAFNKYGKESFKFNVLAVVAELKNLILREQAFIDELQPGYNISPTAGSCLGMKPSEETKQKMSEAHIGIKHSKEAKRKMSKAKKGEKNWNFGKNLSEETRKKISEGCKGMKRSEGTKRKISEAFKGRNLSEETKRKLSEALKGRKFSEETKRKFSEAKMGNQYRLGHKCSNETKKKMSEAKLRGR